MNRSSREFINSITGLVVKAASTSMEELCKRSNYVQTQGLPTEAGERIAGELIRLIAPRTDAELKATGDEWLFEDILEVAGRLDMSVERAEDWHLLCSYLPRLRALRQK